MQQRNPCCPDSLLARPEHWELANAGNRPIEVEIFELRLAMQLASMRLESVQSIREYRKIVADGPLRTEAATIGDNRMSAADLDRLTKEERDSLFAEDKALGDAYRAHKLLTTIDSPYARMLRQNTPAFTAAAEAEADRLEAPSKSGRKSVASAMELAAVRDVYPDAKSERQQVDYWYGYQAMIAMDVATDFTEIADHPDERQKWEHEDDQIIVENLKAYPWLLYPPKRNVLSEIGRIACEVSHDEALKAALACEQSAKEDSNLSVKTAVSLLRKRRQFLKGSQSRATRPADNEVAAMLILEKHLKSAWPQLEGMSQKNVAAALRWLADVIEQPETEAASETPGN